jgi:uncharacterized protein (TIGR02246 family)
MELSPTTDSAVSTSIAAVIQEFMAAFKSKDPQTLSLLYTKDAQVLPPNADVFKGREAIREMWHQAMQAGLGEIRLTTTEILQTEDLLVETGRYELRAESGDSVDTGKYLVIWKQEGDLWRMHRDIWNSSRPTS